MGRRELLHLLSIMFSRGKYIAVQGLAVRIYIYVTI